MSARLDRIRAAAHKALTRNADLLYRHAATWSDGTLCRFNVQDPNQTDRGAALATRLATSAPELAPQDLRLLRCHLDDPTPNQGASLPWQGGTLTVLFYGQVGDFTGAAQGVCRWSPL